MGQKGSSFVYAHLANLEVLLMAKPCLALPWPARVSTPKMDVSVCVPWPVEEEGAHTVI